MSQWANEHPEEMEEISRLPLNQQTAAMRDAIGYDPDRIREYAESRIHCHRPLNTSGASPAAAQKQPAGDGRNFLPHRTPVGSRFRRLSLSCDNCSAPEGIDCQPWCRAEQIS